MATTSAEVWALLREVLEAQKETDRKFQDTDRKFQDTDRKFQDTDRKFQDTERLLKEQSQNTDRLLKEQSGATDRLLKEQSGATDRLLKEQSGATDRLLKEQSGATDRRIRQVNDQLGKLGNRLGEFVEGLVNPAVVRLFREQGIEVHEVHGDISVSRADGGIEIDLLVVNDHEAVLVEVKSKLKDSDVDDHLERLGKFKRLLPRYADVRAMGAVAAMVIPDSVARYAERHGLFVLAQSGDNVVVLNQTSFTPKAW